MEGDRGRHVQRDTERILDEYLAAAARTGDRVAWERLVARWQPRLLRHAWRLTGHPDLARDMVQEAWVEIVRGLRRLDDIAAFPAWAFRIVTRRCARAIRGRQVERAHLVEAELETVMAGEQDAAGERASELAVVRAEMQALPAPQRAALSLFYLEDLSVAEIAVALDVPPGTVKTRLMHARRKIRARLEGISDGQD
ncbi:sigma-70 family RNA polymerase sigma factor [Pseudoxanthomonas sp. LH2527]|nr:sigma-70 family RNA polymerase sigma factor [Pseudoxanthomonas sp. LH2527]MCH6482765.1 sigma-70 family RNA polymerase sigma factor [Pseudoxanthomonas sp. LH2527]